MTRAKNPIPEAALRQHVLLLGKTRSGKSSTARLFVESLLDGGKPVCIIDPKGDWWGLKSSRDGRRAGYAVVIFGGEHADVPLNPQAGAAVAELVATGNRPCIVDLGGWMVGDRTRFFIDFASTLFRKTRGPRWLVIDEAHNFAPQGKVLDPDAGKMLHWANRLASEGAGKGLTLISASQRPQKVHKDYVTSHETLVALRVVHPLDRAAVKEWIDGCDDPAKGKEVLTTLAGMERGQGWVWSPEIGFGPKQVRFPLFSTYDSFAAPVGEAHDKLTGWAEVDLEDVRARLASVVEEAKANDPKALKAEVARLQRELAAARKHPAAAPLTEAERAEIRNAAFKEGMDRAWEDAFAEGVAEGASRTLDAVKAALGAVEIPTLAAPKPARAIAPPVNRTPPVRQPQRASPSGTAAKASTGAPSAGLTKPQARILEALAFWASLGFNQPTRHQLGAVAGYSPLSGNFGNLLGQLRAADLVDYPGPNRVCATPQGAAAAQPVDARRTVRDRLSDILTGPQAKILDALPADGTPISREDLGAATGYSHTSGNFGNLLGQLRTLGLLDYPQQGFVAVEPWVWS